MNRIISALDAKLTSSPEELSRLFEMILLSYFSRYSDSPDYMLNRWINSHDLPNGYQDEQVQEIALAIIDHICWIARRHFPTLCQGHVLDFYGNGIHLADKLMITDAAVLNGHTLRINLPAYTLNQRADDETI